MSNRRLKRFKRNFVLVVLRLVSMVFEILSSLVDLLLSFERANLSSRLEKGRDMLSILRSLIFEVTSNSNSFSRSSLRLISSSGVVRGQKRLTNKLDLILLSVMLTEFSSLRGYWVCWVLLMWPIILLVNFQSFFLQFSLWSSEEVTHFHASFLAFSIVFFFWASRGAFWRRSVERNC